MININITTLVNILNRPIRMHGMMYDRVQVLRSIIHWHDPSPNSRMSASTITPICVVLKAPKIGSTTRGIPAQSGPWLAAPYPFGIAGPIRDLGPVSQFSVCVYEKEGCFCSNWNTSI